MIGSSRSKHLVKVSHTICFSNEYVTDTQVVYKDMKVGFLADDTDHGTRELREIFKG